MSTWLTVIVLCEDIMPAYRATIIIDCLCIVVVLATFKFKWSEHFVIMLYRYSHIPWFPYSTRTYMYIASSPGHTQLFSVAR